MHNLTEILCNYSAYQEALVQSELGVTNATDFYDNSTLPIDSNEWAPISECPLLDISTIENRIKLVAEGLLTIGALYYILTAMRELRFLGAKMFFENLVRNQTDLYEDICYFPFTEHCPIACHVFVFLLADADRAVFEVFLPTRARGSCCGCDYAYNIAIFSLLLQVGCYAL